MTYADLVEFSILGNNIIKVKITDEILEHGVLIAIVAVSTYPKGIIVQVEKIENESIFITLNREVLLMYKCFRDIYQGLKLPHPDHITVTLG